MAIAGWALRRWRPQIVVRLSLAAGRRTRRLVADSGAGSDRSEFDIVLDDRDCVASGGILVGQALLSGAYSGWFNVYSISVAIPAMSFRADIKAAGVDHVPHGFDGIASFKFLNRFHYGNFGDRNRFGLKS